jgi:hypothetical protein
VQLIFRSQNHPEVPTCSVTLQVGHIDTAKDTYEVLEATICKQLNDGHWQIANKFAVVHFVGLHDPIVVFVDELPIADITNNNNTATTAMSFEVRTFISGDLAFFSTILGKPNMSPVWCNWCMLSKAAWNKEGHNPGEKWTIESINQFCHSVEFCGMKEEPSTVMGCVNRPLIDAVQVENFILSILHIIIGVGNSLLDVFYGWIEWRVEKLTQGEAMHRNKVAYAELKVGQEREVYQRWLENEGNLLKNKISEKKRLSKEYSAKVGASLVSDNSSNVLFYSNH